jgi:hypothetical protein
MGASLGFSITALLPAGVDERTQEAVLLDLSRRRPAATFHDVVRGPRGAAVVRIARDRVIRLADADPRPDHAGTGIGHFPREYFDVLVDHGDILVPGWGEHARVVIGRDQRVVADLDEVAGVVDETIWELRREDDTDASHVEFLRTLVDAIALARRELLPIVAHW